ncbi:hypothetical protein [Paenibacillus sp. S150]|uniref:hypothetical protein n=1 Tax=Paenibacillus sp. S150 TaxID=2749826 RepID=UPI001C564FD7|nr:hypothetical protein [Paenibacillus sp. S150]MBW4081289.1 hypothetical protein [Paenibacillus sp. S150]
MERLEDWLKRELKLDSVSYVEHHSHGHLLKGKVQGRDVDLLVVSSGHVWRKKPSEQSWSTTGVYAPERVLS